MMPTQTNFVVGESETRWGRGSVHHRSQTNVKSESQEDGHHHETRIKWLRQFSKQASSPNLETHAQMQVVSRAQPSRAQPSRAFGQAGVECMHIARQ